MHYPVELPLRIDWSELDLFGHVNNVAFMKYVQASRVNYWDTIGLTKLYDETRQGPMLASTACRFKKPLFYPGSIIVKARVDFIKTTSFGIHHIIVDHAGDIAAEAEDVIVMFDFNTGVKIPFPPDLRAAVEKLEGKRF
ncbi:MAG TPA: acyl-CoA thioesterase [Bacteroidia bacterium]|nr:acyl-CoA thioesterase [Bacteroidia bacterium]